MILFYPYSPLGERGTVFIFSVISQQVLRYDKSNKRGVKYETLNYDGRTKNMEGDYT